MIQDMKPTYRPPRGRGRGNVGRSNILAQMGNRQLVAANIAETSGVNTEHPMYKEFMNFIKSKQKEGNTSTYSSVITEESHVNLEVYNRKEEKELIVLLEQSDLKWKDNPWKLMTRYFDTVSYATHTY